MNNYLLTIHKNDINTIEELKKIGTLTKVSNVLNVYQLITDVSISEIMNVEGVVNIIWCIR